MIVVKVDLVSANGSKYNRELMHMTITNDGTITDNRRGNYVARLFRKGNKTEVLRMGRVEDFPRQSYHIGRLVLRCLTSLFPEERANSSKGDKS